MSKSLLDARYIGDLFGSYTLASRHQLPSDQPRIFACRARSASTRQIVVTAPVIGKVGEQLTAHFDELGLITGHLSHISVDGFTIALDLSDIDRAALGAKLDWLKRRSIHGSNIERRQDKRMRLPKPRTILLLPDGRGIVGLIIDASVTGAAISADLVPERGLPLAVGTVLGRVVRALPTGFAVRFAKAQLPEDLARSLGPPSADKQAALVSALSDVLRLGRPVSD